MRVRVRAWPWGREWPLCDAGNAGLLRWIDDSARVAEETAVVAMEREPSALGVCRADSAARFDRAVARGLVRVPGACRVWRYRQAAVAGTTINR